MLVDRLTILLFLYSGNACEVAGTGTLACRRKSGVVRVKTQEKVQRQRPAEETASTRERLVEAARQLFWNKGYEATGLAEVLRNAGVNSGSLYYLFKSKEELLLAVLDRYVEMLHPAVIDPVFSRVADPINRVFGVLEGYRRMLTTTGCRQGCPIGNIALEMSEKSSAVREKIALNFKNWRMPARCERSLPTGNRLRQACDLHPDGDGRRRHAGASASQPRAVRRFGGDVARLPGAAADGG